jgi:hypothetical protein
MDWEELPPVEPTLCTEWPLRLARTGYVDQFDEWRPGNNWTGDKYVLDSTDPSMRVKLRVTVFGKWSKGGFGTITSPKGRLRPHRWVAWLGLEGFELEVGSGRCRTLRGVLGAVEAIDIPPKLNELLRAFYAPYEASCVFELVDGEVRPWASSFGKWGSYKGWPPMRKFLEVRWDGTKRIPRLINTSVFGYASTTNDEARQRAEGLELWTSWIDKSRSR